MNQLAIPGTQDEALRLKALDALDILGTPSEQAYDDITELAAFICGTPVSLISLIGKEKQFFKSAHNCVLAETPRDQSFCVHTLVSAQSLVVEDTTQDERFARNPLVTGEPHVRFYAGAPIVSSEGHVFGTVCVIDIEPRVLSEKQLTALERLARQASSLLDRRALSLKTSRLEAEAITGREEAEQNRQRLQMSLDAAHVATWFFDPAHNMVGGDERMSKLFGLSVREAPTEAWLSVILEADRARVRDEFAASLSGNPYDTRYRVTVDGRVRWLHARARITPPQDGAVRMVGICEDVTREETLAADLAHTEERLASERRFAASRLHLESERLQMSLTISNATSFDWIPSTDAVRWSGMPPFGINPDEIPTGTSSLQYVHAADRDGLTRVLTRAMENGEPYSFEYRAHWANGSLRWVRTAGRAMREPDGTTRFLGVNTDITDRKLAEEALLHTEKLSAVGRLASVISHEINNPLEAVTNLLYIVRASQTLTRDDREHLELADRELARVVQITSQTLSIHRSVDHPVEISVDIIVQEILSLYRTRLTASHIKTRLDLQEGVFFQAFEGDIRQVLNHLLGNAFDAMRNGGILRIRARRAFDWRTGRSGASITVADSGLGIPREAYSRVFEAFYSTKGINGTGLGLWISKRIVHKHQGHLTFRTATGIHHGTIFRLWVPLAIARSALED